MKKLNRMVYLCSVATNTDLFEVHIFKTLGKKLKYNVQLFGENKQWKGFKSKILYFLEGLKNLNDKEALAVCSDCYDVLPLRYANDFENQMQHYFDRKVKIIASAEMYCLSNCKEMKIWHEKSIYRQDAGLKYINAGLIAGKVKDLILVWDFLYQKKFEDDQIGLSYYFDSFPNICKLDQDSEFFQTTASNKFIPRVHSNLIAEESMNGKGTFFVHVPSLSLHETQREYYREILGKIATILKLDHLIGPKIKENLSSKFEKAFIILVCLYLLYSFLFKNKNV